VACRSRIGSYCVGQRRAPVHPDRKDTHWGKRKRKLKLGSMNLATAFARLPKGCDSASDRRLVALYNLFLPPGANGSYRNRRRCEIAPYILSQKLKQFEVVGANLPNRDIS
jgi:hypothetical protein